MKQILLTFLISTTTALLFSQNEWTFVKGYLQHYNGGSPVPSENPVNVNGSLKSFNSNYKPGTREHCVAGIYRDTLWVYGGSGNNNNDAELWAYDILNDKWALYTNSGNTANYTSANVPSSSAHPGAKVRSAGAMNAQGDLYVFGGHVWDGWYATQESFWKYSVDTKKWTWIHQNESTGTYGTGNATWPRARYRARAWFDANGDYWLFGGHAVVPNVGNYSLNDLWKFNTTSNTWSCESGDCNTEIDGNTDVGNYPPNEGGSGVNLKPRARGDYGYWVDASGNFWIYGGNNREGHVGGQPLNDLWKYNPTTHVWTLVKGSSDLGGDQTFTKPGAHSEPVCWLGNDNNLWMTIRNRSIWKFNIAANTWDTIKYSNDVDLPPHTVGAGIPSPLNKPGCQVSTLNHLKHNNSVYMFNGYGTGTNVGGTYGTSGRTAALWRYSMPAGIINPTITASVLTDVYNDCVPYTNNGIQEKKILVTNTGSGNASVVKVKLTSNNLSGNTGLSSLLNGSGDIVVRDATTNTVIPHTITNTLVWGRAPNYPTFPCGSTSSDFLEELTININGINANQQVEISFKMHHCNCNLNVEPSNYNFWNAWTYAVEYQNTVGEQMANFGPAENQTQEGYWYPDPHVSTTIPSMEYGDHFVFTSTREHAGGINSDNYSSSNNTRCKMDLLLPHCFVFNTGNLTDITAKDVNGVTYSPTSMNYIGTEANGDQHLELLFPTAAGKILNEEVTLDLRVFYSSQNCSQTPIQWKMWFVPDYSCPGITSSCWLPVSPMVISPTAVSYPLGLTSLADNTEMQIHPNPSSNEVTISSNKNVSLTGLIIRDTQGKIVHKENIEGFVSEKMIDVSKLSNGIYFLEALVNNNPQTYKFLIQH